MNPTETEGDIRKLEIMGLKSHGAEVKPVPIPTHGRRWIIFKKADSELREIVEIEMEFSPRWGPGWTGWAERADGKGGPFIVSYEQVYQSRNAAVDTLKEKLAQKIKALSEELKKWESD